MACHGEIFDAARFLRRLETCLCLAHEFARHWYSITKDSFVVFSVEVAGASGAGAYLAKYMDKMFHMRREMESAGFKRRWSASRGWPGSGGLQLRATVEGMWKYVRFTKDGNFSLSIPGTDSSLLERVGTDLELELGKKADKRRIVKMLGRYLHEDVPEKTVAKVDHARDR